MKTIADKTSSVEPERSGRGKGLYLSPTITKIGEINRSTKGKKDLGGDPGNYYES
ncbi:MAG: hypothetical protein U9R27_02255 [Campylobacterota bacterium]|nr:hypothetical protein [Campylobacterota bacterium]